MKRILLLAVIAVFVMMPLASFAKTAISDSDLSSVTAQVGVTIDFSNFSLGDVSIATQSWGDTDGFGTTYTAAGYVGGSVTLSTNAVTIGGTMTIDVGTNAGVTAVGIGLPTISVSGNVTQVLKLASNNALNAAGNSTLGTMYMSGISMNPSGTIVIYAH